MKVRNKQTGADYEWPREQWDRLSKNMKILFTVIDENDAPKEETQKISNNVPTKNNRPDTGEATGNSQTKKPGSTTRKK